MNSIKSYIIQYGIKTLLAFIIIEILFCFSLYNKPTPNKKQLHKNNNNDTNISNLFIDNYGLSLGQKMDDYKTKKFVIFGRKECPNCGLFSFYVVFIGCIHKYLSEGYIPIVDLQFYDNIYNKGDRTIPNPWELFFHQPFNYTLEEVKKFASDKKYVECKQTFHRPDELKIFYQKDSMSYWHNFQEKYMPIKNEIIQEAKINMKNFFNDSKNVLGVLIRGTDYIKDKPKYHSIPPTVEQVISDVKEMEQKYHYDYIYFTSEDEDIKKKFIPEFKDKVRYLNPKMTLRYINESISDVKEQLKEFHENVKVYLINIVILSKCLDIIVCRCSGSAGVFILTNGFRYSKAYNLGYY